MGLQGINVIDIYKLQGALKTLCNTLTDEEATTLSRYLTKGDNKITLDDLKHHLEMADDFSHIKVD